MFAFSSIEMVKLTVKTDYLMFIVETFKTDTECKKQIKFDYKDKNEEEHN